VSPIESSRTVFSDSLSVPKTIGIGPIIIAPAPLTFPFFLFFDRTMSAVATMMIRIPAKASVVPRLYSVCVSIFCSFKCLESPAAFNKLYSASRFTFAVLLRLR